MSQIKCSILQILNELSLEQEINIKGLRGCDEKL